MRDVVAMGVELDQLGLVDGRGALRIEGFGPEVPLRLAQERGDPAAVLAVGRAALGDPPLDGFGVDVELRGDVACADPSAIERVPEPFVRGHDHLHRTSWDDLVY